MTDPTPRGPWVDPTFAARYDQTFARLVAPIVAEALLSVAEPKAGETALDLACGTGALTLPLARALGEAGTLMSADLAAPMVSLAAAKPVLSGSAQPRFTLQDMLALGCLDAQFDLVTCSLAFQIVPDRPRALREAQRVLRPGGRLAFAVPGDWSVEPFWTYFWERVALPDAASALRTPLRRWMPDDIAASLLGDRRAWQEQIMAAGFERITLTVEPAVAWFPTVEEFLTIGPFGHIGRAREMITDDDVRERVFRDIAARLQQGKSSHGLPIDITVLCVAGYRPDV